MINIKGLDKGAVLAALYNASKPLGMGFLQYVPGDITPEEGNAIIYGRGDDIKAMFGEDDIRNVGNFYFDYLAGRVMKVNIEGDEFNPSLYDRDNGEGAAAKAIDSIR
jgi:hypothetical protein